MFERARQLLKGKKALFVSNRNDKALEASLLKKLGLLKLDWAVVHKNQGIREIQRAERRIASGKYDIVIVQTGFVSHKATSLVKNACKANDVTFVPGEGGRPDAVLRNLLKNDDSSSDKR